MKNKELNAMSKQNFVNGNMSFYYQRYGKCNPQKCGSACCRFAVATEGREYHRFAFAGIRQPVARVKHRKEAIMIFAFHCPNITIDGRCKYHGRKTQAEICDKFPMTPTDMMYQYVKKYCGYHFKKIVRTKKKTPHDLTEVAK